MIPSIYMYLESFPLVNGKLDRTRLPLPELKRPQLAETYVAPRSLTERILERIWADVLGLDCVGIHDNFFDLGGHSLLLVQVHSKLQRIFDQELSIVDMFHYPTISALSQHLTGEMDKQPTESSGEKLKAGKMRIAQLRRRRQRGSNESRQNEYEGPDKL
jgi:acyl carrier protein